MPRWGGKRPLLRPQYVDSGPSRWETKCQVLTTSAYAAGALFDPARPAGASTPPIGRAIISLTPQLRVLVVALPRRRRCRVTGNRDRKNDSSDWRKLAIVRVAGLNARQPSVANCLSRYRMIESVEIDNFRGFKEFRLSGFRRVNVVVGDNGAGKTALLEALYIAAGQSVDNIAKLRVWRGAPIGQVIGARSGYMLYWGDLFADFDLGKTIRIRVEGSDGHSKTMQAFLSLEPQVLSLEGSILSEDQLAPVTFQWSDPDGTVTTTSTPQIHPQGLLIAPTGPVPKRVDVGLLAARAAIHGPESAQYFSDLSIENKEKPFVEAMKKLFNNVVSVNVELFSGQPSLFAVLRFHTRKYPIHILSDGMNKIAAILLGIASKPKGVFLVDEIEAGLYFKRHNPLWSHMRRFAADNDTQVFATTHSLECLTALIPIVSRYPDQFSLVRVYQENGWGRATILDGDEAVALIKSGLEIRL